MPKIQKIALIPAIILFVFVAMSYMNTKQIGSIIAMFIILIPLTLGFYLLKKLFIFIKNKSKNFDLMQFKESYNKTKCFIKNITIDNFHKFGCLTVCFLAYSMFYSYYLSSYKDGNDYFIYVITRWLVSIYALWSAYKVYKTKPESVKIGVALLTIIFNPIMPLTCSSEMWLFFDFVAILILSHFILSKNYYTNV